MMVASVRVAIVGLGRRHRSSILRAVSADGWCWPLALVIPMMVGSFARGEVSCWPWVAFSVSYARHGIIDAVTEIGIVIAVDLWLLWIPAHAYLASHSEADSRTRYLARFLNLTVGLLLMSQGNIVYQLLDNPGSK